MAKRGTGAVARIRQHRAEPGTCRLDAIQLVHVNADWILLGSAEEKFALLPVDQVMWLA